MPVAELFLSAFLQLLFDRLASRELLNFASREGVDSKLRKWGKTLKMIEAVLNDAEEKQLTDGAVKIWLDDLQDLAYDVEDILDELATDALGRKVVAEDRGSTNNVWSLITSRFSTWSPSAIKFNISMRSKMKEVTRRMEDLCKQRIDLGLEKIAGGSSTVERQRIQPTTCLPSEPAVYGRDEDKAKIIKMMSICESGDNSFLVIPIVGMGGAGKTTLARLVYNDKEMEDFQFDVKAWACVSDDSDILRISKAIIEAVTFSPCNLKDLNQVQLQLQSLIADKKFLLVLDDVWSSDYQFWETLKSPFLVGAPGSKIIVTTRDKNVAVRTTLGEYYNLTLLSDDDCWFVFSKLAFMGRDTNACQKLESLFREKIVNKCKGLPLVARTLGGLLQLKKREDEWENVLNSKIWDLPNNNEILPVLKLSYHHLSSYVKRCFAYCSILPKDREFEEEGLVFLWMAEGLVQESNNRQLEETGSEYFRDLVARSIFQQSDNDNSKFIMHDLVNDLAQWVSGETSLRLEDGTRINKQLKSFERVRHSSYTSNSFDGKNKFEVFHEFEHLRTLLPIVLYDYNQRYITNVVISDLLLKHKKLRVLSLRRYFITEIPNSIGDLKHLRYLNLSRTMIKKLPESTSSLFNLQNLILRDCARLMELPVKMRHLLNLRHLDIGGASQIEKMPMGMKELTCLQTLSNFIVGKNAGSSLMDLKDLKFLCRKLCISGLQNVADLQNTGESILSDKKGLEVLSLEWSSHIDNSRNEIEEENVLKMLQPHKNIKELSIKGYCGMRFPSWIEDSSLSNVVVLRLVNCAKCTSLPSLGKLSSLKDLTIKGMKEIRSIGFEIYGEDCSRPFLSLETLCFEDLQECKYWETIQEHRNVEIFPCLRKLSIVKCPKLTGRLPDSLPSLERLVIRECPQLVVLCSRLPAHSNLEIDGCKEMVCSNPVDSSSLNSTTPAKISEFGNWLKQGYRKVERLSIIDCEKILSSWQTEIPLQKPPQGLPSCSFLKTLCIQDSPNLLSFPEDGFLPSLSDLEIINCPALSSLPEGMKHENIFLEKLRIRGCHSLTFIVKGQLPPSLKWLSVNSCEKLQFLFGDTEDNFSPSPSLLEDLRIERCPSLMCLSPNGQLSGALRQLDIRFCSKLESIAERFDSNMSLREIIIMGCEQLSSLPEGLCNLNNLHLFGLWDSNIVSFPEGGLPNSRLNVYLVGCETLRDLPDGIHNLSSLLGLSIRSCQSIKSFPIEGFPTSLRSLSVENNNELYESLKEWGLHKFTCLTRLTIGRCPDAVSFPEEEIGMLLPTSLTDLKISEFPELKHLSSKGFCDLTSLKTLRINNCPKLKSFPEDALPSSLSHLHICKCPLLKKQCKRDGREWSKIADIPCVEIDWRFIYDPEEEE